MTIKNNRYLPILMLILILIVSLLFYTYMPEKMVLFVMDDIQPLFSKWFVSPLANFSNWFNISLLEIFIYLIAIYSTILLGFFITSFFKKKLRPSIKIHISFLLFLSITLVHWFYLEWGHLYKIKNSFGEIEGYQTTKEDIELLKLDIINRFKPYTSPLVYNREDTILINKYIQNFIENNEKNYKPYQANVYTSNQIKTFSLIPYTMKLLGIGGVYNPWVREVHINKSIPPGFWPFILIHELAHAQGISSEYEANIIAYEVSRKLNQKQYEYSLLLNLSLYLMPYLNQKERQWFLNEAIPRHAKEDILAYYAYWEEATLFSTISQWVYDLYLKQNGITDGTQSYGRFISYIMYKRAKNK